MLISIKRNNVLKTYENTLEDIENVEKKEAIKKKFEDVYASVSYTHLLNLLGISLE